MKRLAMVFWLGFAVACGGIDPPDIKTGSGGSGESGGGVGTLVKSCTTLSGDGRQIVRHSCNKAEVVTDEAVQAEVVTLQETVKIGTEFTFSNSALALPVKDPKFAAAAKAFRDKWILAIQDNSKANAKKYRLNTIPIR